MGAIVIEWARSAVAANLLLAKINIDSLRIYLHSGIANRGQNASPVGISAGPRCLYKGRICDGTANLARFAP
jgi:hypothetical protein